MNLVHNLREALGLADDTRRSAAVQTGGPKPLPNPSAQVVVQLSDRLLNSTIPPCFAPVDGNCTIVESTGYFDNLTTIDQWLDQVASVTLGYVSTVRQVIGDIDILTLAGKNFNVVMSGYMGAGMNITTFNTGVNDKAKLEQAVLSLAAIRVSIGTTQNSPLKNFSITLKSFALPSIGDRTFDITFTGQSGSSMSFFILMSSSDVTINWGANSSLYPYNPLIPPAAGVASPLTANPRTRCVPFTFSITGENASAIELYSQGNSVSATDVSIMPYFAVEGADPSGIRQMIADYARVAQL